MTVGDALLWGGVASLVVSGLLVTLSIRVYIGENIRGVRADLAGRRRMPVTDAEVAAAWSPSAWAVGPAGEAVDVATQVDDDPTLVERGKALEAATFELVCERVMCEGAPLAGKAGESR